MWFVLLRTVEPLIIILYNEVSGDLILLETIVILFFPDNVAIVNRLTKDKDEENYIQIF